jgi:hypothetical protein
MWHQQTLNLLIKDQSSLDFSIEKILNERSNEWIKQPTIVISNIKLRLIKTL